MHSTQPSRSPVVGTRLHVDTGVEALEDALDRYGTPEIVNTDQGSQFTSEDFVSSVVDSGAHLSMEGGGVGFGLQMKKAGSAKLSRR